VDTAAGDVSRARRQLETLLAETSKRRPVVEQFSVRLALAEVEARSGAASAARARAAAVEAEASRKGLLLFVKQARAIAPASNQHR
jgi:hypothetical protein